jgi:hypothetical protein
MPDLPIVIPDIATAPKDYTLSGTQELALKTVRALIDGTGAGAAFLPTLQLLDPNGHVMWEGATSSTVAAGGSADVSWFPGLGGNSGGSSTSPPIGETAYLWGVFPGMAAVPSGGGGAFMRWNHFQTTNTSVFGTDTSGAASPPFHNAAGDSYLYFQADGFYQAAMSVEFPAGAYAQFGQITTEGSQWDLDSPPSGSNPAEDLATNVSPTGFSVSLQQFSSHMFYVDSSANPGITRVQLFQTSGVSKSIIAFNLGIFYLGGNTGLLTQIY